jgi:hypothetical protein
LRRPDPTRLRAAAALAGLCVCAGGCGPGPEQGLWPQQAREAREGAPPAEAHPGAVTALDESGGYDTLDADLHGAEVRHVYLPEGGSLDLRDCETREGSTSCVDEAGRRWEIVADPPPPPLLPGDARAPMDDPFGLRPETVEDGAHPAE